MRNHYFQGAVLIVLSLILIVPVSAMDAGRNTLTREEEPVIISVDDCPAFEGSDIEDIFVYRWVASEDSWQQVPFEIDEKIDTYFDPPDNKFNNNDEIVIYAADAGDRACRSAQDFWMDKSINPIRYEISVKDSYSEAPDTTTGWFYIYKADDTPLSDDYIRLEGITDSLTVNTDCYFEQFLYRNPFVIEDLGIKEGCGGDSTDVIDRRKTRTCITVLGLPLCFDEEDLVISFSEDWTKDGNLRGIVHLEGKLQDYDVTVVDLFFYRKYIKTIIEMHFEMFPLDCDSLRYSTDFRPDVTGMYHVDNGVEEGVQYDLIDGVQPDPPLQTKPINSFNEVTQENVGSWFEIIDFDNVLPGHPGKYNYYNDGGPDPSGTETGNYPGTFGEAGVKFKEIPREEFDLIGETFFSSSDLENLGEKGRMYNGYYYNPMIYTSLEQRSDMTGIPACDSSYVFSGFYAVMEKGVAVVSWKVEPDEGLKGLNLYRKGLNEKGKGCKLNEDLLPPRDGGFRDLTIKEGHGYIYTLEAVPKECKPFLMGTTSLSNNPVGNENYLGSNYPNPFNPNTTIPFMVPGNDMSLVVIKIFDTSGKLVKTLKNEVMKPGYYCSVWDGTSETSGKVGSGVYFCRLQINGSTVATRKMLLVK